MKTFRDEFGNKYKNRYKSSISCQTKGLESLEGAPNYVDISFYCNDNNLKSLEGAPMYVGGDFNCARNDLKSLEGAPGYVGGYFGCDKKLLHGENLYIIITSLIRGRYHKHIKEGKEFKKHILDHLNNYLTL